MKSYTGEQSREFERLYSQIQGARKKLSYYRLSFSHAESAFYRLLLLNIVCLGVFIMIGNRRMMKSKAKAVVKMGTSESNSEHLA